MRASLSRPSPGWRSSNEPQQQGRSKTPDGKPQATAFGVLVACDLPLSISQKISSRNPTPTPSGRLKVLRSRTFAAALTAAAFLVTASRANGTLSVSVQPDSAALSKRAMANFSMLVSRNVPRFVVPKFYAIRLEEICHTHEENENTAQIAHGMPDNAASVV